MTIIINIIFLVRIRTFLFSNVYMEDDALSSARVIQRLWRFMQFEVCSVQVLLYFENILLKHNIYIILSLSDDSIKVKK